MFEVDNTAARVLLRVVSTVLALSIPAAWFATSVPRSSGFTFYEPSTGLLDARHFNTSNVGMNNGFYTFLAASFGARVYAFELQPHCVELVNGLLLGPNKQLLPLVTVLNTGLGSPGLVSVPRGTCEGRFGTDGLVPAGGAANNGTNNGPRLPKQLTLQGAAGGRAKVTAGGVGNHAQVAIVPPANVLPSAATFVKMDTEGAEGDILPHMVPLVAAGRVRHLVVELLPRLWELRGSSVEQGLAALEQLQALSSRVLLLDDPVGFDFPKAQLNGAGWGVEGPLYYNFSVAELVRDRYAKSAGCNVWFSF
ncbi:hypothetical protein TSOC_007758 [Tetrabaena socialis]|uniref:Methyltransferase FkbM domain-containing protein n=1 Tax=Tetrabaena socialis TaxID=47790 RepID=A0A2J8A0B3_9CHLO|nr:hypothetical protein TSOC_007758 [Tetrabaena socialis]|eukprot:PNH05946.1 hypothetical protein TSOC_007758 [Tetrabaena socialis]